MVFNSNKAVLKLLCIICLLQILFSAYLIFKVYLSNVAHPGEDSSVHIDKVQTQKVMDITFGPDFMEQDNLRMAAADKISLTVLGKAAISTYLWEHILEGSREVKQDIPGMIFGQISLSNATFKYMEGPALLPSSFPHTADRIILIGNGRTLEKVYLIQQWLNFFKTWHNLPKVVLIMLGNERCENDWLFDYMRPEGPLRGVFVTYDVPYIDNKLFFQWPLGVATYRHFPNLKEDQIELDARRRFLCNIQATNYPNSSRSTLFKVLRTQGYADQHCHVVERKSWRSNESVDSMNDYIGHLIQSDLTLCPAGVNTETYRVYEAMASGSVPVIEDQPSGGTCDKEGWRLLKQYNAPVIWIQLWDSLADVLKKEQRLTLEYKVRRRKKLHSWYLWFRTQMRKKFLSFVNEALLRPD